MSSEDLVESPPWVVTAEEQARVAVTTEWEAACKAGDIQRTKEIFHIGPLGQNELDSMMHWSVYEGLLEPTQCLLELGADPKKVSVISLAEYCPSLDMFKLLAEFGLDYNNPQRNILEQVPNLLHLRTATFCDVR